MIVVVRRNEQHIHIYKDLIYFASRAGLDHRLLIIMDLPQDVLEKLLVFVGDPRHIAQCTKASRTFLKASGSSHVWRELAYIKYGEYVADSTAHLYGGNWKSMVVDDDKKGAIPTLEINPPVVCNWKYNHTHRFYCCLITAVKWHRGYGEIRVYIDVRGETDLRHPMSSTIAINVDGARQTVFSTMPDVQVPVITARSVSPYKFISDVKEASPSVNGLGGRNIINRVRGATFQHYKGYLAFDEHHFSGPGKYNFCYANKHHDSGADYQSVELFSVPVEDGLEAVFKKKSDLPGDGMNYALDDSFFATDTPQIEKIRWEKSVPSDVLSRSDWYG